MMPGRAELGEMESLLQALRADWAEVCLVWRDNVAEQFKRQFWDNWDAMLSDFINVANDVSEEMEDQFKEIERLVRDAVYCEMKRA
jgi:hypothetical protein